MLHLYSFLLLLSTFYWMALPYNNGLDMTIQQWIGAFKIAVPEKAKPDNNRIIFVDVSKAKYLIPLNSDSTENDVITNRKYLTELFQYIANHKNKVKYIFADIIFDTPTPDDSALKTSINLLGNKFLGINTYGQNGDSLQKNLLGIRSATASVTLQSGSVYKIPFMGSFKDTMVPYKIYSDLYSGKIKQNFLFTWFTNKGLSFNSQINNYPLRNKDFTDGNYVKIGLGELVSLLKISPELFSQYLQDRYILIGDFENDVHDTYLSTQSGTLILFNAYWYLKNSKQILSVWYLIFLYLALYAITWLQVHQKTHEYKLVLKIKFFQPFKIPVNIISVTLLLIIFTCISSLIFNVNISIFHLVAIFSIVDIVEFFIDKIEKRHQ